MGTLEKEIVEAIPFFVQWKPIRLMPQTRLYKFTGHALFDKGKTTPWWALVDPRPDLDANDPGYHGVVDQARMSGKPLEDYIRDVFAVMYHWNSMSTAVSRDCHNGPGTPGLVRVQFAVMVKSADVLYGPAAPVAGFRGGAFQIYIPGANYSGVLIGAGMQLLA